jgi:hypothetical protein
VPISIPPAARRRAARAALGGLALVLAFLPVFEQRRRAAEQRRLLAWLGAVSAGPVHPELAQEIAREPDLARARIAAAREVLAAEMDPARLAGLPAEEARAEMAASARRLAGAADLAASSLAVRPAAWDAALVLGGATYLARAQARDPRLFTAYRDWERPLAAALELGRNQGEPARLLAAVYLEMWNALAPAKRAAARGVVAAALRDPDGFSGLIGPWLAAAPDREAGLALVPDDPRAWARIEELSAARGDWDGYRGARERRRRALTRRLAADLGEAEERLYGGDPEGARSLFLAVASRAERSARGAELLERALEQCPAGPADAGTAGQLAGQLDWVLDRCLTAGCPLEPTALRRLARLCRDLDPPQEALAELLAGEIDRAELVERGAAAQWSEAWAPYLIAKARVLAGRGRLPEAAAALAQVNRSWQGQPSFWSARREVARAAGDPAALAAAEGQLARLAASDYSGTAWTFRRGRPRLEILAPAAADGVRIAVDEAPERGAAVEVRLDGLALGSATALSGHALAVPGRIAPGPHLLEIESLAGGAVAPGDVRLAPAATGSSP